jgi:hypothetical protein
MLYKDQRGRSLKIGESPHVLEWDLGRNGHLIVLLRGPKWGFSGLSIPSRNLFLAQEGIFLAFEEVGWYSGPTLLRKGPS